MLVLVLLIISSVGVKIVGEISGVSHTTDLDMDLKTEPKDKLPYKYVFVGCFTKISGTNHIMLSEIKYQDLIWESTTVQLYNCTSGGAANFCNIWRIQECKPTNI